MPTDNSANDALRELRAAALARRPSAATARRLLRHVTLNDAERGTLRLAGGWRRALGDLAVTVAGRRALDAGAPEPGARSIAVMLTPEEAAAFGAYVGSGNLSRGIRAAVRDLMAGHL